MKIFLDALKVDCIIGDMPEERETEQTLEVSVEIEVPGTAAESDNLGDTVDYAALAGRISDALKRAKCRMIERAAKTVWETVSAEKNAVSCSVRVTKRAAVPGLGAASATYP